MSKICPTRVLEWLNCKYTPYAIVAGNSLRKFKTIGDILKFDPKYYPVTLNYFTGRELELINQNICILPENPKIVLSFPLCIIS